MPSNNPNVEDNLKPFKKGQSGNPKGRPRKLVSHVLKELEKDGVKPVTPREIRETYLSLVNLPIKDIRAKSRSDEVPMLVRLVSEALLNDRGYDYVEKMLDRAIGKARQSVDHTTGGEKMNLTICNIDPLNVSTDDSDQENSGAS